MNRREAITGAVSVAAVAATARPDVFKGARPPRDFIEVDHLDLRDKSGRLIAQFRIDGGPRYLEAGDTLNINATLEVDA